MTIRIRKAVEADRARCLELLTALASATGGALDAGAEAVFDGLLDGHRGAILVAEEDDALLGMASVSFSLAMRYGGEYCQLEELIVDPAARGRKLGERLVRATLDLAAERGCAEYGLYLVASTEGNWPFYERFGFERVGTELRRRL
jgi:glucosamine-phosphate N-acetyltransferase